MRSNGFKILSYSAATACLAFASASVGWAAIQTTSPQDVYKLNYFSNNKAAAPDATVRIDNPGLTYGNVCGMIYVYAADEQLAECCGCPSSQNGLRTLSVKKNLTSNPLTGVIPVEGVIKLVSTKYINGCDPSVAWTPSPNLRAWGTHIQNPVGSGAYPVTETEFTDSLLGATEMQALQAQCAFIHILGSGFGVCSCGTGH